MHKESGELNIFQKKGFIVIFATAAMLAWGAAYPFIKLGMAEFQIENSDTAAKILFAGIRFFAAGIITLIIARLSNRYEKIESKDAFLWTAALGTVNTALHYMFFYIGLSHCTGSRGSIIYSMGTFMLIIFACVIFKEKMTGMKVLGCLLGIGGIITANSVAVTASGGSAFSLAGEGIMIVSAAFGALGGIITRITTQKINAISATGYSMSIGGALLTAAGLAAGGRLDHITAAGIGVLMVLIAISVVGFVIYNQLLSSNPVGSIAIFNALIPVFGTILSCIILDEPFYLRYPAGLLLIATGIRAVNRVSDK